MKSQAKKVAVRVEGTLEEEEFIVPLTFTPSSPQSPSSKMETSVIMEVGQDVPRAGGAAMGPPEVGGTVTERDMLATIIKNQETIIGILVANQAREAHKHSEDEIDNQKPIGVYNVPYSSNQRATTLLLSEKRPPSPIAGTSGTKRSKGSNIARGKVNF